MIGSNSTLALAPTQRPAADAFLFRATQRECCGSSVEVVVQLYIPCCKCCGSAITSVGRCGPPHRMLCLYMSTYNMYMNMMYMFTCVHVSGVAISRAKRPSLIYEFIWPWKSEKRILFSSLGTGHATTPRRTRHVRSQLAPSRSTNGTRETVRHATF